MFLIQGSSRLQRNNTMFTFAAAVVTLAYNSHSMKQLSWVTCYKTAVWPMTKTIFQLNLRQKYSLRYDKSTAGPMTKLLIDLWQKCGLTHNKTTKLLNKNYTLTYNRPTVLPMTNKQTFTCDKNEVWPMTKIHVQFDLWQIHYWAV